MADCAIHGCGWDTGGSYGINVDRHGETFELRVCRQHAESIIAVIGGSPEKPAPAAPTSEEG